MIIKEKFDAHEDKRIGACSVSGRVETDEAHPKESHPVTSGSLTVALMRFRARSNPVADTSVLFLRLLCRGV